MRACAAYKAYLPPQRLLPRSVPLTDQMLTVWPVENPFAPEAIADSCDYAVDHYDQFGGLSAISDAARQGAKVDGDGPYLVGWSPANARGDPDRLVLVVDMSGLQSQDSFNQAFLFWQRKIVENPDAWRSGFQMESLRLAIRDFADQYGSAIVDAVKLWSDK